jgi:hypothetical protein
MGHYLSRNTVYLVLDSGAYVIRKEREESLGVNHVEKYQTIYGIGMSIFFEPIPKFFLAIASGVTPIGSAVVHLIERSRQKKDGKLNQMIKNQLVDKWLRQNWLHFVNNKL